MTSQTRVGDIGIGVCNQHPIPLPVTVTMITGGTVLTDGVPSCNLGAVGVASCGHSGVAVSGTSMALIDNAMSFRVGDIGVVGGGSFTMVSGSPKLTKGDVSGSPSTPTESSEFPGFSEGTTVEEVALQSTEDHEGPLTDAQRAIFERAGVQTNNKNSLAPPPNTDAPAVVATTPLSSDDSDIAARSSFDPSFRLSANYVLGHLTTLCALETGAVRAQSGLTIQQIVSNLRGVAVNILEPLLVKYGRPTINCGFRPATASYGSPTSAHKLGQAVDLQWPGLTDAEYHARACWIRDNLHWTQIILEYGGNRPWIHVSYDQSSATRTNTKSRVAVPNRYENGLILATNVPKVGCK